MKRSAKHLISLSAVTGCLLALAAPAGASQLQNMPIGPLPASCTSAPNGSDCTGAVVSALDTARARLGLGPYRLPSNFDQLPGTRQIFILANLDRSAAGLPPIEGIAPALTGSALTAVIGDVDPDPTGALASLATYRWTSNWAGGWANAPYAYYEWMYDDGYNGPETSNVDCTAPDASGCWDHRRNVLAFNRPGTIVMGAAVGHDAHGQIGYAMTIVWTPPTRWAHFSYTWMRARAAGAGGS